MRNRCWRAGQSDFRQSSMVAVMLSIAPMTALVSMTHQSAASHCAAVNNSLRQQQPVSE